MWNDGGGIPKTSLKLVWTDQEQNEEFFIPDVVLMGSPNTPYPLSWKKHQEENNLHKEDINMKTIYFAGGCFWGMEAFMKKLPGVAETTAGYANGRTENPTYQEVCSNTTGHAETVKVVYDPEQISLELLLKAFFKVVDPTELNRQGGDVGEQYRNGIYYVDVEDRPVIEAAIEKEKQKYANPVVTECMPLACFYDAEEYHQDYLNKNPAGYCHINLLDADEFIAEEMGEESIC